MNTDEEQYFDRGTQDEWHAIQKAKRDEAARRAIAACRELLAPLAEEHQNNVSRETSEPCRDHQWMESTTHLYSLECRLCPALIEHPKRTEYLKNGSNTLQRTVEAPGKRHA